MATAQQASGSDSVAVFELAPDDKTAPEVHPEYDTQRDRSLLCQNAVWFCQLRWIIIVTLATIGMAAFFQDWTMRLGLRFSPTLPLAVAGILAVANGVYLAWLKRLPDGVPLRRLRLLLWAQIVLDLLILTVVVHYLGSRVTYAPVAYLFHIVLACMFFQRSESLMLTVAAAVMYLGLLSLESTSLLAPASVLVSDAKLTAALSERTTAAWQLAALLATWFIIWYLVSRLAARLWRRECELAKTNRRLEASSIERARHMLQTTHQLKAPFAAIHANTQLLLGGYAGEISPAARRVIEKIAARSLMLSGQIQQMLQLANLRSEAEKQHLASILDLESVIKQVIERIEPQAATRGITIETRTEPVQVRGSEDYLRMLVDNLVTNAVNYSHERGRVSIACQRDGQKAIAMVIRDYGIGIPAAKLSKVFDDYYRTSEAAQHNKTSTGLGLAIVRLVARALHATVRIESAPGWGTRVTVKLPAVAPVCDGCTVS